MTTIGSLRYDIVADASKFTQGMTMTRRELSAAQKLFMSTRTPTEKLDMAMDGLNNAFRKGAIDAQTYARAVKQVKTNHAIAKGGISGTVAQFKQMPGHMKAAAKGFVAYRAAGVAAGQVGSAFRDAMDIEKITLSFKAMLGSAEAASKMVTDLRQLDQESSFDFTTTARAAQLLMGYGIQADDVITTLRSLGDISVGDAEKMMGLANAFGQATSMGRLMAQEKNQMINAGFNPMQEIVARTGETMAQLTERMGQGKVSASELSLAIQDATSAGGRFDGMMSELMSGTSGKIDALSTEWAVLKADLASAALPAAKIGTGILSTSLKGYAGGFGGDQDASVPDSYRDWFAKKLQYKGILNSLFGSTSGTIGDKPHQQYTAAQLEDQQRARDAMIAAQSKPSNDPAKQHQEAQAMRAKQVEATERQTEKTQELIDAQPVAVE